MDVKKTQILTPAYGRSSYSVVKARNLIHCEDPAYAGDTPLVVAEGLHWLI